MCTRRITQSMELMVELEDPVDLQVFEFQAGWSSTLFLDSFVLPRTPNEKIPTTSCSWKSEVDGCLKETGADYAFLAYALHQPAPATCLPANNGQLAALSAGFPWYKAQLLHTWPVAYCVNFLTSTRLASAT